jgi:uncharacterized membrane protein YqjE
MSIRVEPIKGSAGLDGPAQPQHAHNHSDAPLKDLLRQLADEGANLVRGEIALAKLEMKETGRALALDAVKIVSAMAMAWIGALALTAFAIIGLGSLLGGMYWASALIVGLVLLAIGGIMAQRGLAGLKGNSIKPEATVESLQQDKRWASQEVRELKEGLKS